MRKKLYPYFFCCPRFRPLKLTLVVPLLFIVYLVQKDSFVQFWNISSRHYVQFKPSPASPLPNIALKAMQCNPTHRAQSAYQGPITVHLENDQQDLQSLNDARVQRFVDILPQKDLEGIYGGRSRPRYSTCAVVGSASLLATQEYGQEINSHEAVFRINSAPVLQFFRIVGMKTTYNIVNPFKLRSLPSKEYITGLLGARCPQFLLRHELLVGESGRPPTRYISTENFKLLIANKCPLYLSNSELSGAFTGLSDFNMSEWLLGEDRRMAKENQPATFSEAFVRWHNQFPSGCPSPRVIHPAFDVYVKKFAGIPRQTDFSTGIWTVLLATTMCDAVNVYGFGGPMSTDGVPGHYYDPRMKFSKGLFYAKLGEINEKLQEREDIVDRFSEEANDVLARSYHPISQERALLMKWSNATQYDIHLGGRVQLDMQFFKKCVPADTILPLSEHLSNDEFGDFIPLVDMIGFAEGGEMDF